MPEARENNLQAAMESIHALGRITTDTDEGRDTLEAAVQSWLYQLEQVKWPRGLQYFENVSYLSGNHLTRFYYNADAGFGFHQFGLHDKSQFDNLVAKSADNRLIRPVETVVGMLTENRPQPRVEPNTELPEDEDAATLAELLLDLLWENPLRMPQKLEELAMVAMICGTGAIEVEYGETDLPIMAPKQVESDLFDEGEEPDAEGEPVVTFRKDIQARVWTPFHLNPDPAATSPHDMTWIACSSFQDVTWVQQNFNVDNDDRYFPEKLRSVQQDAATKSILYWWSKFQDVIESPQYYHHGGGLTPQTFTTHGGAAPNQCIFTVVDVRPSADHPEGRTLVVAGGALLYAGPARAWSEQYPWRWHPYSFFSWFKPVGRFWGIPLITELLPLQKKINAIDALVQANRQFLAIGQWLLPKHSKVPEGMVSGIPGQHVTFTDVPGMAQPTRVPHVPLPADLLMERDQLNTAIDHISASGVVDAQVSKSAARAGVMLDFLRQEKLRSKGPMLMAFQRCAEQVAQNILIEVQLNILEEDEELTKRLQTAAREHSELAVQGFVGSSLRDHHAVKIDIADAARKSPEAKGAKGLEFIQYAQTQDPATLEAVWRAIGMDDFDRTEEQASVKRARRMIARIRQGRMEAAFIMPGIDKPAVMLPILDREIMSDRFYSMGQEQAQAILSLREQYTKLHEQEVAAAMQKQIMMQAALAKAGGGKPQGGSGGSSPPPPA